MDRPRPQLHQSVHQVLNDWPRTAGVFVTLKTACVGCYLARFCTLADVAATYHLSSDTLMEKFEQATQEPATVNSRSIP
jgi:hypothetical protein